MVANLSSLLVPTGALPQPNLSWLGSLTDSLGGAVDELGQRKSFNGLADRIGGAPASQQQGGGFLSRLIDGAPQQQTAATPITAPIGRVDRSPAQGSTYQPFIETVKQGGLVNPYGLAAVAATGRAESGWSAQNANRTWNDGANDAGGIMSWNGPRLAALRAANGGTNGTPEQQAKFFLAENPELIQKLNNAQSPQEAADIMANAWRFKGYDQQGGEAARRRALAQNYYAQDFRDTPAGAPAASAPNQVASLDPSIGIPMPGAAGQMRAGAPAQVIQPSAVPQPAPTQVAGGGQSAVMPTQAPQMQPQSNILAAGVTPVTRGSVDPSLIQFMLRDPNLRETGLQLWAANSKGQNPAEPWQFINLPDGTLARANQQTGQVERIGQFAKPQDPIKVTDGETLLDPVTKQPIYAQPKPKFTQLTPEEVKANGLDPSKAYQRGPDNRVYQIGGDGTTVNVDNGTIPQGFQAERDANGRILRLAPIPGGPADNSSKQAAQADSKDTITDVVTTAAQRARAAVTGANISTGGLLGRVAGAVMPTSNAAEVRRQVGVLKSNATIENLNAMRQQSPTGGALGSVTESENAMLSAKAGALDPDSPNFLRDLNDYEHTLLRIVHGKQAGDLIYQQTRQSPQAAAPTDNTPPPEGVDADVWSVMTPEEKSLWQK